ncbi:MAG TPA: hypothetical protein VFD66_06595 [Verrucomicrobiae bacterium]|nr:hypothetical protein [Verrucomicrobiae bacterium]
MQVRRSTILVVFAVFVIAAVSIAYFYSSSVHEWIHLLSQVEQKVEQRIAEVISAIHSMLML